MTYNRLRLAAAVGIVASVALASPAQAHHAAPLLLDPEFGECGETTLTATLPDEPHGSYAGAALVVQVGDEHHVAPLGEPLTVGPFEQERVAVSWRIWGGGERSYDAPPLNDLDALLDFLAGPDRRAGTYDDREPTDKGAWGAGWNNFGVEGCVPEPSPSPTVEPEPSPSVEPSAEPTAEPSTSPASGVVENGDDELPKTGSKLLPVAAVGGSAAIVAGALLLALVRRRREITA